MSRIVTKINKLKNWQVALIIAVIGLAVFGAGLVNPFIGDDNGQILNSAPVHSITNIKLLFEGGTFYVGDGLAPLSGVYFRPLMTTTFALLYTLFGPHAFYFHVFQLMLGIGSAFLLYLVFRYSFKVLPSLFLALVFLIHPIDSQAMYRTSAMQDALLLFFGISAIYILLRFRTNWGLVGAAGCLFMSLLAKESAIVFVMLSLLLLFWFDQRKRLYTFMGILVIPVATWLILKTNAVGLMVANSHSSPIEGLSLGERIFTMPSIFQFYIVKFLFPWRLATEYNWTYPQFSFVHFVLPLIFDLVVIGLIVYGAIALKKHASKAMFYTYLYFGVWFFASMALIMQIVPVDMTAADTWFYFSMAGLLGMIGVVATVFGKYIKLNRRVILALLIAVLLVLGIRTSVRAFDFRSAPTLAVQDIKSSPYHYNAYNALAIDAFKRADYDKAEYYASKSVAIHESTTNTNSLGGVQLVKGEYPEAYKNLKTSIRILPLGGNYVNLAQLTTVYGDKAANVDLLLKGVNRYPNDKNLWFYLIVQLYQYGDLSNTTFIMDKAATEHGVVLPPEIQQAIINKQPFDIKIAQNTKIVTIKFGGPSN